MLMPQCEVDGRGGGAVVGSYYGQYQGDFWRRLLLFLFFYYTVFMCD